MLPVTEEPEENEPEVEIDQDAISLIRNLPQITFDDQPHAQEHSIEVHIPFLQEIFPNFKILPLSVGNIPGEQVSEIIEMLWGDDSTRFLISTDLSHYQNYETAKEIDAITAKSIESFNHSSIGFDQACGCIPVSGMLIAAQKKKLRIKRLNLKNSFGSCNMKIYIQLELVMMKRK